MKTKDESVSQWGGRRVPSQVHEPFCDDGCFDNCEDSYIAASSTLPELDRPLARGETTTKSSKAIAHEPVSQKGHLLSYARWCSTLVPEVLRTRTPFGAFLSRTIQLSKCLSSDLAPAFFPLPIPPGYWHEMPAAASAHKRRAIHRSRALHVIVMGLNFWHSGGHFIEDHLLQRAPNSLHTTLYKRIRALLRSDGPASAFEVTKAGRRFPELVTRLGELSEVLTKNGCSSSPYEKCFPGIEVPKDDTSMPELQPYRDLNPDRLTLFGTGKFDATSFLSDPLIMPYRDPTILEFPNAAGVQVPIRDSPETVAKLASVWDKQGLLLLHREAVDPNRYVRIFNAYKSVEVDRQIGDRRSANSYEARISEFGPSCCLPSGSDFSELALNPRTQSLSIYITDRKDFYHQFWVSRRKALANTVGPGVPCSLVEQCESYPLFMMSYAKKKKYNREKHGDMLHGPASAEPLPLSTCHIAFKSILQGDHCGVDIATDSHMHVLQSVNLLERDSALVATSPLRDTALCQGLVIDDYFALSVEEDGFLPSTSAAHGLYQRAQDIYKKYSLLGSPHKDILGEESGKVIGAWINASKEVRSRGLATVSAPAQKRLGLSHVSLKIAQLSSTTDVLHLCLVGGWASVMGFRRPMYSLFNHAYNLVSTSSYNPNRPRVVGLSRLVANELVLAAVLHPLMMTDIGCKYHDRVFATDASSAKGAICSCPVSPLLSEVLWKTSKTKGSYTRLLSPSEVLLRRLGIKEELDFESPLDGLLPGPPRPLAYRFDFIEVFAGAAKVTSAIQALGIPTGPPIELSFSEELNVVESHVMSWLTYLVSNRLVLGIMAEPPCTTFSIIRRPALRSRDTPYGYNPHEEKTATGNILGCRACQLMKTAGVNRVAGLLETTFSSMLKHLLAWKAVQAMECTKIVRVDSCRFASPHLKSFRMMCVHLSPNHIDKRCICTTRHLQVQGKYTKASATYTDQLAHAIALDFAAWIQAERTALADDSIPESKGLESIAINDLAVSGQWSVDASWSFRKESHINILEEASLLRLAQRCAHLKYPTRITAMVDSNVVRGASSKGRSSSTGLSTALRRFNAVCVAAALYFSIPFCPTRMNPSDDPTRDTPLRPSFPSLGISELDRSELFELCTLPRLRRWAANWSRLIIRLAGLHVVHLRNRQLFRRSFVSNWFTPSKSFDSTLGYPGEGPLLRPFPAGSAWTALGATVSALLGFLSVRAPRFPFFSVGWRRLFCWSLLPRGALGA